MAEENIGLTWLVSKLKGASLPVIFFAVLAWVLRGVLGALAAKVDSQSALIALVALGGLLIFQVLQVAAFIYVIKRLLDEIARVAQERDGLQDLVMQPRLTTAETGPPAPAGRPAGTKAARAETEP